MGEEKKEETKAAAAAEEKKAVEEKKEEKQKDDAEANPPLEIVLKVDMHCEACAKKVVRALKGFQGVDEVKTDSKTNKVVVKGKGADPIKVCERLQKKSGRKVELISPLPPPQPEEEKKKEEEEEEKKQEKEEDKTKKEEPPAVVTIVLNVRMHCEACAQVLQKRIRKIQGIESVETNLASDQVTVKGVIEPEKLVDYVYKRTGKQATVVKKEEEKKKDDKKEPDKEAEKKESEESAKGGSNANEDEEIVDMMNRSEYWPSKPYSDQYAYPPHPQIFSDENPNACSLM